LSAIAFGVATACCAPGTCASSRGGDTETVDERAVGSWPANDVAPPLSCLISATSVSVRSVLVGFHVTVTHPDFRNSIEEFHPHKTLSTLIKLLSSLFINMVSHQHN
jgi:hypothetical protein